MMIVMILPVVLLNRLFVCLHARVRARRLTRVCYDCSRRRRAGQTHEDSGCSAS